MKYLSSQTVIQFIKFSLVGLSNTLLSLIVYYVFLWIDENLYLVGNIAGWVVSVANAFFWNNKYVFADKSDGVKKLILKIGKTYLSYGGTFLLSTILLYLEVESWRWSAVLSPILNLLVTIPLNFILNKFWTFR